MDLLPAGTQHSTLFDCLPLLTMSGSAKQRPSSSRILSISMGNILIITVLLISSLISVSASQVFLPKSKLLGGGDGTYCPLSSSWHRFRGGAVESIDIHDTHVSSSDQSVAPKTTEELESSTISTSTITVEDNNAQTLDDHDEMMYATIGVFNIPGTANRNKESIILLSCNKNSEEDDELQKVSYEKWGVVHSSENGHDANYDDDLVLAEISGCLCHGIVINLSQPQICLEEDDADGVAFQQYLDDMLLCVAEGIIRRMKGTQRISIPITLTFDKEVAIGEENHLNNIECVKENAKEYVQGYMERAFCLLWNQLQQTDSSSILDQCKTTVSVSHQSSKLDTATEMAKDLLQDSSSEVKKQNIVPRSLFGVLSKQVFNEIHNRRVVHNNVSAEWKKLSEDYRQDVIRIGDDSEMQKPLKQPISAVLKQKVESLMAMAFVDAEELLLDMEHKMDSAFLEFSEDEISKDPMPNFGSDADAIVNTMSASFYALLAEQDDITETESEWVNEQRIEALKQVVGTGIHRLFHIHLQNLRDHFGRQYEYMLGKSPIDNFGIEGQYSEKDKYDWNQRRQEATRQAEEGFRKAAFGSIPRICQHPGGELCNEVVGMYTCVEALRGLLEDIYEVTVARGLEEEEWQDIMSTGVEDTSNDGASRSSKSRVGLRQVIKNMKARVRRRGPAKWYERWALKALVIGVNYIQGWIVLQALRREARKRDLDMPKFPLF